MCKHCIARIKKKKEENSLHTAIQCSGCPHAAKAGYHQYHSGWQYRARAGTENAYSILVRLILCTGIHLYLLETEWESGDLLLVPLSPLRLSLIHI